MTGLLAHARPPVRRVRWRPLARLAVAVAIVAILAVRFGAQPFLSALTRLSPWTVLAAAGLAAVAAASSAWRWCVVAGGLRVPVRPARAVPAYLRSQFLDATLPGGIVGDVHRGVRRHAEGDPLGRALRAVAWERLLGQGIGVVLAAAALLVVPSPLRAATPVGVRVAVAVAVALGVSAAVVLGRRSRTAPAPDAAVAPRRGRVRRTLASDWGGIVSRPRARTVIVASSSVATAAYVATFLLAARSIDPGLAASAVIPAALVILVIGALPANLGGWGPREGAAAWIFGVAGLGAADGLAISVLYGMLCLIGTLPGAVVLLTQRRAGDG